MNIENNIMAANKWGHANRKQWVNITMEEVLKRFKGGNILSLEADAKTAKGGKLDVLTGILYLAPHSILGFNFCPAAETCIEDCLFNAGRGGMHNVTRARMIKGLMFLYDRDRFTKILERSIKTVIRRANERGMQPAIRINGTSDLPIERVFAKTLERFDEVQFYDYTKQSWRFERTLPSNYHLTFSYDGINWDKCKRILQLGGNVTAVFKDHLPEYYQGIKVIDGDETDVRFLDKEQSVIVGLKFKAVNTDNIKDDRFIITDHLDMEAVRCNKYNQAG